MADAATTTALGAAAVIPSPVQPFAAVLSGLLGSKSESKSPRVSDEAMAAAEAKKAQAQAAIDRVAARREAKAQKMASGGGLFGGGGGGGSSLVVVLVGGFILLIVGYLLFKKK